MGMESFGHILLVLWIAASNLAFGFFLAMAMGHGPRRMPTLRCAKLMKFKLPTILKWKLPLPWRRGKATAGMETAEPIPPNSSEIDAWQLDPENLERDCRRLLAESSETLASVDEPPSKITTGEEATV